jgi:hypothetical protein
VGSPLQRDEVRCFAAWPRDALRSRFALVLPLREPGDAAYDVPGMRALPGLRREVFDLAAMWVSLFEFKVPAGLQ